MREDTPSYVPVTATNVSGISLTSTDEDLFLIVEVRHPSDVQGDCQLIFWPDMVSDFVPGRGCHLDGTVDELVAILPNMTYHPPRDFFGTLQLEVVVQSVLVKDAVASWDVPPHTANVQTIFVDIEVLPVNDPP